jgi:exosome complex exonuclease DIS3/RRP44
MASLSLWSPQSHYRQTRKGKILQSTSELYLRDDLGLGFTIPSQTSAKRNNVTIQISGSAQKINDVQDLTSLLVPTYCSSSREEKIRLVIVDTNVLLHNLDVLEHPSCAISNIVVPQTALLECRHRSFSAYNRTMDLLRSSVSKDSDGTGSSNKRCVIFFPDCHHIATQLPPSQEKKSVNDDNDARIRQVAMFFGESLVGSGVEVTLLTDDKNCRALALKDQRLILENEEAEGDHDGNKLLFFPKSVREHIAELEKENGDLSLSDFVAQFSAAPGEEVERRQYYPAHLPLQELSLGVKSGKFYQGYVRVMTGQYDKCYVTVKQGEERVAVNIIGLNDMNRSVDGDLVAIELHPVTQWIGANEREENTYKYTKSTDIILADTAEPLISDESNVVDVVEVPLGDSESESLSMLKPTGKVIGIIRRNFKNSYCGSIFSVDKVAQIDLMTGQSHEREEIARLNEVEHLDGSTTCVFFAVDARIPPVLVRTTQRERLLGKRILIAIDSWPSDSPYPLGHYVKTLGDTGMKDVETEVLLHEHNIPCDPFPAKVWNDFNFFIFKDMFYCSLPHIVIFTPRRFWLVYLPRITKLSWNLED